MSKAVQIVETRRGMAFMETKPRYDVMLNGKLFLQLYFNMRGYAGYLPVPPSADSENQNRPTCLQVGEKGISAYKKELGRVNKEWAEWHKTNKPIVLEKPIYS